MDRRTFGRIDRQIHIHLVYGQADEETDTPSKREVVKETVRQTVRQTDITKNWQRVCQTNKHRK
jgi:hypothetical protein